MIINPIACSLSLFSVTVGIHKKDQYIIAESFPNDVRPEDARMQGIQSKIILRLNAFSFVNIRYKRL
jgi:hypothetical protein